MGNQSENKKILNAYLDYMELSDLFFSGTKKSILNVWELKEGDKFYDYAKKTADLIGIKWEGMTCEQSDQIILGMLEDRYMKMKPVNSKSKVVLDVKLKVCGNERSRSK